MRCPTSPAVPAPVRTCGAPYPSRRASSTWSAPTTRRSTDATRAGPYIDMVIPSLTDPSVAPPGKHVMSCFVQYAPYHLKEGTWDEHKEAFGDTVIDTHRRARAEHQGHHPAPPGSDAARSRTRMGPDRRQHLPGRADARAAVLPPPRARLGAVSNADQEPLHVRLGHTPRRRNHGRAGEECGEEDTEGDRR